MKVFLKPDESSEGGEVEMRVLVLSQRGEERAVSYDESTVRPVGGVVV